ncbi:MAG: hypothetical protein ACK5MK_12515 [Dysgonomonas sp.]
MDSDELALDYMKKYNELIRRYNDEGIKNIIEDLNKAIRDGNIQVLNTNYGKILEWNYYVANLDGVRTSLNTQFTYLHLPSVIMYTVIFDENEKSWTFNTNPN